MFPTDQGESVSKYVSRVVKVVHESGLDYQLTPMGTIVEAESLGEVLDLVKKGYESLESDCDRVYSSLKLDIRKKGSGRLQAKIRSVEDKIGPVKK